MADTIATHLNINLEDKQKLLELIEAKYLFDLDENYFHLVIHPQSIIHSIVTYVDGSSICQMSNPDMKVPIAHALSEKNSWSSILAYRKMSPSKPPVNKLSPEPDEVI